MNKKIDKFLLGLLWLLAATLGICFWFNTKYGFDIFSKSHWQHLAYMQASQNPVQTEFYISLIVSVFITVFVLHILVRPKLRKFQVKNTLPQSSHVYIPKKNAPTPQRPMAAAKPAPQSIQPDTQSGTFTRPARLNIPQQSFHPPRSTYVAPPVATTMHQPPTPKQDYQELESIFTAAGYTITKKPNVPNNPVALVAIGAYEKLWIGGVGISIQQMQTVIDKLQQIFADTLDEIMIDVTGFIVSPTRTPNDTNTNILLFKSVHDLQQYVFAHRNQPDATDEESIRAFETYINTVMDYIGKI